MELLAIRLGWQTTPAKSLVIAQVRAFLDGTTEVAFKVPKAERNSFIEHVLKRFGYSPHGKADKGVLLRYLERMTGLSDETTSHLTRLANYANQVIG